MSGFGGPDVSLMQPAITAESVICSVLIDGSITTLQPLITLTKQTFITDVQIIRVSGAAVTLATISVGYNGAVDDVVQLAALVNLATVGVGMPLPLRDGFAVGQNGSVLSAKMGIATAGASTFRVTVIGIGG